MENLAFVVDWHSEETVAKNQIVEKEEKDKKEEIHIPWKFF
jgi:hypothetical protein